MNWDEARASVEAAGDGVFIRLKDDGAKFLGVVCDFPEPYQATFADGRTSKRYLLNVYLPGSGMKVWDLTTATLRTLLALQEEVDLDKHFLKVRRSGRPRDPQTTYLVTAGGEIPPEVHAEINGAKLHDLERIADGQRNGPRGRPQAERDAPS